MWDYIKFSIAAAIRVRLSANAITNNFFVHKHNLKRYFLSNGETKSVEMNRCIWLRFYQKELCYRACYVLICYMVNYVFVVVSLFLYRSSFVAFVSDL